MKQKADIQHPERMAPEGPIRTCVGCRSRDSQRRLLRVALCDGRVAPDPRRRLPGRGAYLHPRRECLERAARKGGLSRAFRRSVPAEQVLDLGGAVCAIRESGLPPAHGDGK